MQAPKKETDALAPSSPMLTIREGDSLRSVRLGPEPVTVGRSRQCGIILKSDKCVSRVHCEIVQIDGQYTIFDKSGGNGIFVNGARLETRILLNGDEITLGGITIVFNVPDVPRETMPESASNAASTRPAIQQADASAVRQTTRRHRITGHASVRRRSSGVAVIVILAALVTVFAALAIFASAHANRAAGVNVTETGLEKVRGPGQSDNGAAKAESATGPLKPLDAPVVPEKQVHGN